MNKIQIAVTGLVAGVTLAIGTATLAQPAGGTATESGHHMGFKHSHGEHGDSAARVDARMAELKTQLKITTAQEPAFQAFSAAAKQQAASRQALHAQVKQAAAASAPDRMAQHVTALQQQGAALAAVSDSFKSLYASLTPEQKALADQNVGKFGGHGKGHGHHHQS